MVKNLSRDWDKKNSVWTKLVLRGMTRDDVVSANVWCANNTVHGWMYHPVVYAYPAGRMTGYVCYKFENPDEAFAFKLFWSKSF